MSPIHNSNFSLRAKVTEPETWNFSCWAVIYLCYSQQAPVIKISNFIQFCLQITFKWLMSLYATQLWFYSSLPPDPADFCTFAKYCNVNLFWYLLISLMQLDSTILFSAYLLTHDTTLFSAFTFFNYMSLRGVCHKMCPCFSGQYYCQVGACSIILPNGEDGNRE